MGLLESLAGGLLDDDDDDDVKKKGVKLDPAQIGNFVKGAVAIVSAIGIPNIIKMFKKAGLGDKVASWIGKGKNLPISGEEVEAALGSDIIKSLAKKTGLDTAGAAASLARYLPKAIDILTPDGKKASSKKVAKETEGFDLGDLGDLAGSLLGGGKGAGGLGGILGSFLKK